MSSSRQCFARDHPTQESTVCSPLSVVLVHNAIFDPASRLAAHTSKSVVLKNRGHGVDFFKENAPGKLLQAKGRSCLKPVIS